MKMIRNFFVNIGYFFGGIWAYFFPPREEPRRYGNGDGADEGDETALFPAVRTGTHSSKSSGGTQTGARPGETLLFEPSREQYDDEADEYDEEYEEENDQREGIFIHTPRRRPFILNALFTTIHMLMLAGILLGLAGAGAAIGVVKAYMETAPAIDEAQLTRSDRTSYLYDMDGNLIASLADIEFRDWVTIDQIPLRLQNAFIAVEDVRFYLHNGVDFRRLFSVALEVLGSKTAAGGSTITQQLIKNKVLGSERTYKRKIQEIALALELEKYMDKPQILEAYLNDINLGESNYGVKAAAADYFGKELDELTVRECAMLASVTQNPTYYNLRKNKYKRDEQYWKDTVARTDKVINNMYEAGFITEKEYEEALAEDVRILELSTQQQMYDMPYFVEYVIRDVVTHLIAQRGLLDTKTNRQAIESELRTGGYHIYTTVDTDMQNLVQDTLSTWDKYPPLKDPTNDVVFSTNADGSITETIQPQSSAVVFDYHSGELRVIVGGRDTPTIRKGLNRAYQSAMEIGSSIKPLAVYGPALDNGLSPTSVIANFPGEIEGWGGERGHPTGGLTKLGPTTVREGIVNSLNVVAARTLYERSNTATGAQYLESLGADPANINADGPGLALGTSGLTTIQLAAAYGAIAAGGEYKEPLSFRQVVDSAGNVIMDANEVRDVHRVFKKSTAYLLVDMLTDAVGRGTGTKAKIKGMTVAGKTGTNDTYKSVCFAGMTPYYTASVWVGHDYSTKYPLKTSTYGSDYAAPLWQAFMSKIHEGLADKPIIDESPAEIGLVQRTICTVSGNLATDACNEDNGGHKPITDWVAAENAPADYCSVHVREELCSVSGMISTEYCPTTTITSGSVVLIEPGSYFDQFPDDVLLKGIPNYVRINMTAEEYAEYGGAVGTCPLHTGPLSEEEEEEAAQNLSLQWAAANLRDEILAYLDKKKLPVGAHNSLLEQARALNGMVRSADQEALGTAISAAEQAFAGARNQYGS